MIKTFRSRGGELLFARKSVALFQAIELAQGVELIVRRKLAQLNAAVELRDLALSPENCLEPLTRETKGQHGFESVMPGSSVSCGEAMMCTTSI